MADRKGAPGGGAESYARQRQYDYRAVSLSSGFQSVALCQAEVGCPMSSKTVSRICYSLHSLKPALVTAFICPCTTSLQSVLAISELLLETSAFLLP